jgi:hypothetical protein
MALEDALRSLNDEPNGQLNWAIGDLLRQRAEREDWRSCAVLRQLETGDAPTAGWNELLRGTRAALVDETMLSEKARTLLQPQSKSFDLALDDFIAEMLAVHYLALLGHVGIRFPSEQYPIMTDIISVHEGITYVTEAKNLREPVSLGRTAFRRWHYNRAADPTAFNFRVEILEIDDPFEDLSAPQAKAICNLIDELPLRSRPSEFSTTLPENRNVLIRITDATPALVQYGQGPFLVAPVVEDCQRSLIVKLLEPIRKALTQLYSPSVPDDYRRLLFIRWKPPDAVAAIGEADHVRTIVMEHCQSLIRAFFPNFALAILHTVEDVGATPKAMWT